MLKVDLHLHTAEDPADRIACDARHLIDRAAELGFDALAITLHDLQLENARLTEYARSQGVTLIRGVERTVQGRHLLLLNFPARESSRVSTMGEALRAKERTGGLVIAPHPFFPGRSCLGGALDRHPDLFDAIEWSYFWTQAIDFNAAAARWARANGKPLVGNSDLHDIRQLGRTFTLVDAPNEADAICHAIREGRVQLCTSPVPYVELTRVFGGLVARSVIHGPGRQGADDRPGVPAGTAVRLSDAP